MGGIPVSEEIAAIDSETGGWLTATDGTQYSGIGDHLLNAGQNLSQPVDNSNQTAGNLYSQQSGQTIDAFQANYTAHDSPSTNLDNGNTGLTVAGLLHKILTPIVEGCKAIRIGQLFNALIEIADLIAEAVATAFSSLAMIPLVKIATDKLGNLLANKTLESLMGGGGEGSGGQQPATTAV